MSRADAIFGKNNVGVHPRQVFAQRHAHGLVAIGRTAGLAAANGVDLPGCAVSRGQTAPFDDTEQPVAVAGVDAPAVKALVCQWQQPAQH